ncbi:hypothetical protein CU098_009902 [Rhizopus stolonifer]|uniref:Uncharacterized protein n=1 Tax=Rhizopus stolonifer TaxID=4846 RepID=A0A367JMY2_RHIST|nr:hypothetical protein CU098_009902 [Rhizopus stolonifer]
MPTIRRNYLANTHATMHREAETTAKRTPQFYKQQKPTATRQTQPLGMHPSVSRNSETTTFERKSANNYTLITKPKTKVATGYCSQLDNLDNLNDLRSSIPARKIGFRYTRPDTKAEPERPWRRHTQSSKVKLIQPNEQNLKKEYNDMKYDDRTHSWKGNESSLIEFQEKRRPRLMLMTNKQQKPSKYAAAVGNHMIFHAESQKWVSAFGISEECNELDQIEDLNEEMRQIPQRTTQCANKMLEFKLSVETKRQMMYEQEQHEAWIKHWPLKSEEAQITTCSGQLVGASKYCLFRPFE